MASKSPSIQTPYEDAEHAGLRNLHRDGYEMRSNCLLSGEYGVSVILFSPSANRHRMAIYGIHRPRSISGTARARSKRPSHDIRPPPRTVLIAMLMLKGLINTFDDPS